MSMVAPPKSRYAVILPVIESMSALHKRYEGFQEILLESRKDMELVGVYNCRQDGRQAYDNVTHLLQEQRLDALYASNVIIEDVARAVSDAGFGDKILLIGHDLTHTILQYLKERIINISIGQEPEKQGYLAIEKLCRKLLLDEEINEDIFTKIEIVIAENLAYI